MKTGRAILFALLICLLLTAADDTAKSLPDGAGREAVVKLCFDCHGAANFRKLRLNKDDWSDKVDDMVDRGANGTDDELDAVIGYLAQNFGPDSKILVNTAPFEELKAVLGLTVPEAQAVVSYRDSNGAFHSISDLEKVPGVDSRKIEAKKEIVRF